METLLTLVIAVGGIATGIGAIWTAAVTRRQARVTEESFSEQNERARLNLEVDLLMRLEDRFHGLRFLDRRKAAKHVIENVFVAEHDFRLSTEAHDVSLAALDVLTFFGQVGYLTKIGALRAESADNSFHYWILCYWALFRHAVERIRQEWKEPRLWEDFERLYSLVVDLARQRGINLEDPTNEDLRAFVEAEAVAGEDRPAPDAVQN